MIYPIVVLLVTIIAFIPQCYRIIKKGNTYGINHRFLFMMFLAANLAWNRMLFDFNDDRSEHKQILYFLITTVYLIGVIFTYMVFVTFYDDTYYPEFVNSVPLARSRVIFWTGVSVLLNLAIDILTIYTIAKDTGWQGILTEFIEIIFLIVFSTQYFFQILDSFRTRRVGAFSMASLVIRTVFTIMFPIFLMKISNVIMWLPYLISSVIQFGYLVFLFKINRESRNYAMLMAE